MVWWQSDNNHLSLQLIERVNCNEIYFWKTCVNDNTIFWPVKVTFFLLIYNKKCIALQINTKNKYINSDSHLSCNNRAGVIVVRIKIIITCVNIHLLLENKKKNNNYIIIKRYILYMIIIYILCFLCNFALIIVNVNYYCTVLWIMWTK